MECLRCQIATELRRSKISSTCSDCGVVTSCGDRLCSLCSEATERCSHCRSRKVYASFNATGSSFVQARRNSMQRKSPINDDVMSNRHTSVAEAVSKLTQLDMLKLVFSSFGTLDDGNGLASLSRSQFCHLLRQSKLCDEFRLTPERAQLQFDIVAKCFQTHILYNSHTDYQNQSIIGRFHINQIVDMVNTCKYSLSPFCLPNWARGFLIFPLFCCLKNILNSIPRQRRIDLCQFLNLCYRLAWMRFGRHGNRSSDVKDTKAVMHKLCREVFVPVCRSVLEEPDIYMNQMQKRNSCIGDRSVRRVLRQNSNQLQIVFTRFANSLDRKGMALGSFIKFCRAVCIFPKFATFKKLEKVFISVLDSSTIQNSGGAGPLMANFDAFVSALATISMYCFRGQGAFHSPVHSARLLLLRVNDYIGCLTLKPTNRENDSLSTTKAFRDRKALWSWTSRAIVAKVFELYERRSDTGSASQCGGIGITRTSFLRFVRDLNEVNGTQIDVEVSSLILSKVFSISNKPATIANQEIFAMTIAEIAAHIFPLEKLSTAIDKLSSGFLCNVLRKHKKVVPSPMTNPLSNEAVRGVILDNEASLKQLFFRFASHSVPRSPHRYLMTRSDLEHFCRKYLVVPNLVSFRKLACIFREVKASRFKADSKGRRLVELRIDEFLEVLARISAIAFEEGCVLGRKGEQQNDAARLMLLLGFLDSQQGGGILSPNLDLSHALPQPPKSKKLILEEDNAQLIEMLSDTFVGSTPSPTLEVV